MTPNQSPITPSQSPAVHEEVHLSDYITIIMRRRRTFLLTFLAVFTFAALVTFLKKPVYEATATLYVKDDSGSRSGKLGELALLSSSNPIAAEIEIVKSRTIAEQVVKRLHLDWSVKPGSRQGLCKLLEFSSTDAKPAYQLQLIDGNNYSLAAADGTPLAKGVVGQLLKTASVTLLVGELRGSPGDLFDLTVMPFNRTVDGLRKGIKVSEVGKKTNIIRIAYQHTNPVRVREVVNTMVQGYLDQTVAFKSEEASRTVGFVEEQIKGVRSDLDKSELDLQGYKSASGVVKLDSEAEELIKKTSEVEKERAVVTLQKKQLEYALASLKEAGRKGTIYSPAATLDPLVSGMATRLTELEIQKRALLSENTDQHPQVKALQGQIDELQSKLRTTFESTLRNLTKQESDIGKRLDDYEAYLRRLPVAERDLARFTRVAKVNANVFTFLLQKQEEARIAQAATISNIKVVDPAIIPDKPIKPQKKKNLVLGLLVGLMLGIGLAFFHDYMDDTVKDAEEARRLLGWAFLGLVPHIATENADGSRSDANLISHQKPMSAAAESFRSLRTALHYAAARSSHKVMLVTSAFPGEGKTTIAANLAEILAQTGARVMLIGCDMRLPTLHEIFEFSRSPGLTEFLAGDCSLDEAIHRTGMGLLDAISAGATPPNPAELLGSEPMTALLDTLRERYDYIILDAPPVLAVSDTPILVPVCDLVLVLLEAGRVPQKAVLRMREMLATVEAPVAGFIINDKSRRAVSYGYGYGGYGYGGYGYGDEAAGTATARKPWYKQVWAKLERW